MEQEIVLKVQNVCKAFKGNSALSNVKFELFKGEIHTLLGENGAGKSTLLNIMSGSLNMDSGNIYLNDKMVNMHTPHIAKELGIIKVHQELQVVPEMKVYENVFLGNEILNTKTRFLSVKKMIQETNKILQELGADFDADDTVKYLSIAQQQLVEIAKALKTGFSVLILDEPTSSLTNKEIKKLFEIMRALKNQGKSIIFVSHRLEEIYQITDRITILRDGKYIDTLPIDQCNSGKLIKLMTGREWDQSIKNSKVINSDQVVLSVRNLCSETNRFQDISFDLHKGEILGFAGLIGSGRTETMRAIFGADKLKSGEIFINGKKVKINSPKEATALSIALIPEDRKAQGMVPMLPNMNNVCLSSYKKLEKMGMLNDNSIKENALLYMNMLKVKPCDPKLNTENLSGGNQQKIVIGKWLSINAKIIIMDEPTRGIDVGAKEEIHNLMLKLVDEGASIIMISSELPEILKMSNRIIVMHEGRISGEIAAEESSEDVVLNYAMGVNYNGN